MADRLTTVDTVREEGSWLFTIRDEYGELDEAILVPCDDEEGDDVEAWINRCTHEAQRLDRGFGAAMRDGQIICPKHGSMFDSCSGYCDNGDAADTTLPGVDVTVTHGDIYLTDDDVAFEHEGGIDDDDDGPDSTSHIGF
ncbi:Rieske (2Fe-2S) protein [Halostella pelagica]|uniref:Rieske (2Fe-2S) protein n=1 Tax=Halostella pelagica TaxID=2583824 RepID=UPI001081D603|nr:Rieske 2Fe-2S domain-containing protein [Halostella pelagica]